MSSRRWRLHLSSLVVIGAAAHLTARGLGQKIDDGDRVFVDTIYYDEADVDGRLRGGVTQRPVVIPGEHRAPRSADVVTLTPDLNLQNRIDLVFVGDGYTASELDRFHEHVDLQVAGFFDEEPFITYGPYFVVHRVDVVSNESGVDHDPVFGVYRDTALDMGFWCGGIERLLCVDVGAAYSYARNAPDIDLVAAIANSTKYGGAGYVSSDLATASGGNSSATEVLLHEFGHALGDLADEYHYFDGARWTGGEVPEPNASKYTETEIRNRETKWARWLGVDDPQFDGLVSAYEGARYHQFGLYRPTNNSLMNSLNRPFNLPSVEAIVIEMYQIVQPIDNASPDNRTWHESDVLFVDPIDPAGRSLDIQWYVNGDPIPGAVYEQLEINTLNLSPGSYVVSVRVVDNTEWVRDELAREEWMTQSIEYDVEILGEPCLQLGVDQLIGGAPARFSVEGGAPGREVAILWSQNAGSFIEARNGWCVEFNLDLPSRGLSSHVVARGVCDGDGRFVTDVDVPIAARGRELHFQAAMRDSCPEACMSSVVVRVVQ